MDHGQSRRSEDAKEQTALYEAIADLRSDCKRGLQLKDRPEGSRHVVMITDGVDSPGGKVDREKHAQTDRGARDRAHHQLHGVCETEERDKMASCFAAGPRPPSSDPITATDPTLPPGTTRSPSYGVSITFDPAMRGLRKAYEAEVKKSQQALKNIADETGGKIMLPLNSQEMLAQANEVARAIGAEYVVTYRPKRPLAEASRANIGASKSPHAALA
jgi:hypothetical protein